MGRVTLGELEPAEALILPGFEGGPWQIRGPRDPAALALADRHYSRRRPGSGQIGPPGRKVVLVTPCERAVWVSHWPFAKFALDGLDAWRCTIFRNEGAGLSSELIRSAMALTAQQWRDEMLTVAAFESYQVRDGELRPAAGWVTWIEPSKVRSANPGYCFKRAGWWVDRAWTHPRLIRLRA